MQTNTHEHMSFNTGVYACSIMLDFSEIFARQFFIFRWVGFNLVVNCGSVPPHRHPPSDTLTKADRNPALPSPLFDVYRKCACSIMSGFSEIFTLQFFIFRWPGFNLVVNCRSIPPRPHHPSPLIPNESVHARSCLLFQKFLLDNFHFSLARFQLGFRTRPHVSCNLILI